MRTRLIEKTVTYHGKDEAENFDVQASNVNLYARGGNDIITVSSGRRNDIYGERGDDTIILKKKSSGGHIRGGHGNDTITVESSRKNRIEGDGGRDTIFLEGTARSNTVKGGAGADVIYVRGISAGNEVSGGDHNDKIVLEGGKDNDVSGGADDDQIFLMNGSQNNTVHGGTGFDEFILQVSEGVYPDDVESNNVLADYSFLLDDVDLNHVSQDSAEKVIDFSSKESLKDAFGADGTISVNLGYSKTANGSDYEYYRSRQSIRLAKDTNGYYRVNIGQTSMSKNEAISASHRYERQRVYWAGAAGGRMAAASTRFSLVMVGATNGDTADAIEGSRGDDTIYAGSNDSVYGGAGNDSIRLEGAVNATVELRAAGGRDSVTGFEGGFGEASNLLDVGSRLDAAKWQFSTDGENLSVSVGEDELYLESLSGAELGGNSKMKGVRVTTEDGASQNVAVVQEKARGMLLEGEEADRYIGSESSLDASQLGGDVVIDLGNQGRYGSTGHYKGIVRLKGTDHASNILVGAADTGNTLEGGRGGDNCLYGGGTADDVLVGSSGTRDLFGFGAGDGADTVENFGIEDAVYLMPGRIKTIQRNSERIKVEMEAKSTEKTGASLTLKVGDAVDQAIGYTTDGENIYRMKIGLTNAQNTFTYESGVNGYAGGTKGDTLQVLGSEEGRIYLGVDPENPTAPTYSGIRTIDASLAGGKLELGGDDTANLILGGSGENVLWGGNGVANDTLVGGTGANVFWMGKAEGQDIITSSHNGDKVLFHNAALADIDGAKTGIRNGALVVTLTDGSSITLKDYAGGGAETFQFTDGGYRYDRASGSWSAFRNDEASQ